MASEKIREMVRCIDCKHGTYKQWFCNPVICICRVKDDEKFVAASKRICPSYEERAGEPEITHFDHY